MKKVVIHILLVVCSLTFLGSATYLGIYYFQAYQSDCEIEQLVEYQQVEQLSEEEAERAKKNGILEKYLRLHEKNPDMWGWIKIPGTKIDYPVMQKKEDEEYYLHRNFKKEEDKNGLPFLDDVCDIQDVNNNLMVYGHHMKSGRMFTDLMNYEKKEYWDKYPHIHFDSIYETGIYQVFAAFYTEVTGDYDEFRFYDYAGSLGQEKFDTYVRQVMKKSIHPGKKPVYGQTLLTMVTCSYHAKNGRFVVVAAK